MPTRVATIFGFLFSLMVCFVILSTICFQPTTAISKSKSSRSGRQKDINKGCRIENDGEKFVVICPKTTENNKKKCNGCRGKRGPRGSRGPRGQKGKQGPKGRAGARGGRGPPGTPGRVFGGIPGPKGVMGPPGRKGEPGNNGAMGPRGYKGEQGIRGSTGSPGIPGLPGNCISGAKQLASTPPPVHCVRGQVGPPGFTGATGRPGPKGDKGERGSKGRKGSQGPPGVFRQPRCNTYHTKWVDVNKWYLNSPEISCNRNQYLHRFKTEGRPTGRSRRFRYAYVCCTIETRS